MVADGHDWHICAVWAGDFNSPPGLLSVGLQEHPYDVAAGFLLSERSSKIKPEVLTTFMTYLQRSSPSFPYHPGGSPSTSFSCGRG